MKNSQIKRHNIYFMYLLEQLKKTSKKVLSKILNSKRRKKKDF